MDCKSERIEIAKANIEKELMRHNNSWENWYDELEPFRKALRKYFPYDGSNYFIPNGLDSYQSVDHHVLGYLSPLGFKAYGFDNKLMTGVEQIIDMSNQLKKNGIDFIYAALPCKKAVYPELFVDKSLIPADGIVTPQWRKFVYELLRQGIEVIDMLPILLKYKVRNMTNSLLYSIGHTVGPIGCELIAEEIAMSLHKYNQNNKEYSQHEIAVPINYEFINNKAIDTGQQIPAFEVFDKDGISYKNDDSSEIALFGNCNLGADICGNGSSYIAMRVAYKLQTGIDYIGRILPFTNLDEDKFSNINKSIKFKGKKVAVYVGFPSASFVRPLTEGGGINRWDINRMMIFKNIDDDILSKHIIGFNAVNSIACHIKDNISRVSKEKAVVWGMGPNTKAIIKEHYGLLKTKNIEFIVDKDPALHGQNYLGYNIVSPLSFRKSGIKQVYLMVMSDAAVNSIIKDINKLGDQQIKVELLSKGYKERLKYMQDKKYFYQYRVQVGNICKYMSQDILFDLIINGISLQDHYGVKDYLVAYNAAEYTGIKDVKGLISYFEDLIR